MATIQKITGKKGATYRVELYRHGMRQSKSFKSRAEAKDWMLREEPALRHRAEDPDREEPAPVPTVKELIDRFVAERLDRYSEKNQGSLRYQYKYWTERIGHMRADKVTRAVLAAEKVKMMESGKKNASSVNRYLAVLSKVFTVAVNEWELIDDNPCRKVRKEREPENRTRYLSADEIDRLLKAADIKKEKTMLRPLIIMALCTGMRRGELMNIRWTDIDWDTHTIKVWKQPSERLGKSRPRTLPLIPDAMEVLRNLKARPAVDIELVFPREFPRRAWEETKATAGLADIHFHDLRHSCASHLVQHGVPIVHIQQILGHTKIQMTLRYAHLCTDNLISGLVAAGGSMFAKVGNSDGGE